MNTVVMPLDRGFQLIRINPIGGAQQRFDAFRDSLAFPTNPN